MAVARIVAKGQVTIPEEIRRSLGVDEGDTLLFDVLDGGEVRLRGVKQRRITELFGSLRSELPFPGKEAVREVIGEAMGARDARECQP